MKTVLADLFTRLVARIGSAEFPALALGAQSPPEMNSTVGAVIGSAVIEGVEGDKNEPHALFVIAASNLAPDSSNLLAFAARRAQAQRTPYFVIWTLRDAVLWRTPKLGTAIATAQLEKLRDYEDNYDISPSAGPEIFNETRRRELLSRGQDLLQDLMRLYRNQALELVQVESTYFVARLLQSVHSLLPLLSGSLIEQLELKLDLRAKVQAWAILQGIAGGHDDPAYCESIARQIIYRLLGKVLFYQSLRRAAKQLPKLELDNVDTSQMLPTLRAAFREALKIDYHAVFAEDVPDTLNWPATAAKELAALVHDFNTRDFAQLPQDVIGTVFERLIPPEERHALGQYFTPEPLCDFTLGFCVRSATDKVLDPTCGTGTFLLRGYDRLRWLGQHDHAALLSQLWGIDLAPFPAELAVINLFRQNLTTVENFPRIACRDFLSLSPGDTLPFPPPKMDVTRPAQIDEPIPNFDAIVGNFPYVSADQIEKRLAGYFDFIRDRLLDGWFVKYPRLFKFPGARQADFEKLIALNKHAGLSRTGAELSISSYADLYVYLFFHAARFLRPGGRIGIVTSNAWLDVAYGGQLQRFFCDHFKIVAVLESRCEPWFTDASVNTVLTILERCDDATRRDANLVRFVKVKRQLAELLPGDPRLEAMARWKRAADYAARIESTGRNFAKTHPLGVRTEENEDMRIRVCRQGELRAEVEVADKTVKWGKFLRSPEVFFDLSLRATLCLLREVAVPRFGSKTRINEFFHVTPEVGEQFAIEDEYLKPLIKSPKESKSIGIDLSTLALKIFVCRRTKTELSKLKHSGAMKYIAWGEKQRYSKGEFKGLTWPEGAWVKNREPGWYSLPNTETNVGQIFFLEAFGERHVHPFSPVELIPDKRLYFLQPVGSLHPDLLAACLNSTITSLALEVCGRLTLGDGVLEFSVEDARDYLLVPDVRKASANDRAAIETAFAAVCLRPVGSVFEEVKQKDRQALDAAVLRAIGIDPKTILPKIYEALCELVQERLDLAEKRGKQRKVKARKTTAEREVVQKVRADVFPNGPPRFPDDFFAAGVAETEMKEVLLPEAAMTLDTGGFIPALYAKAEKWNLTLKTAAEGEYLLFAHQAGHRTARVPTANVEMTRTLNNYRKYLREQRKTLYEAFFRETLDAGAAARLTQSVWDSFRLPTTAT